MKIAIFGATGNTGIELVKQSLEKGHQVTSFVRDPSRLSIEHSQLNLVTGDVFDPASDADAVQGQDAIVCALGLGRDLKKTTVRATGTTNIIHAMKQHNVQRLLVVTAMGTGDSWDTLSLVNKFFLCYAAQKQPRRSRSTRSYCNRKWFGLDDHSPQRFD